MVAPPPLAQFKCPAYKVDLSAAAFGQCVCGKPKAAHSAASLRHKGQTAPKQGEDLAAAPDTPEVNF